MAEQRKEQQREQPRAFVFGLGYVGTRLANALVADGWAVSGSVRQVEPESPENDRLGDEVRVWQWPPAEALAGEALAARCREMLQGATAVLFTAPVSRASGEDPFWGQPEVRQVLVELAEAGMVDWAGYLSTTSVYGDHAGAWVDEDTPAMPTLRRGELRVKAEQAFLFESGLPMHVFRLPGIYGPGRGPISRVRKGSARCIVKEGQTFSRAHVDDIVGVLRASMARPNPGRVYNVVDDEPAMNHEVIEYACSIMGVKAPAREDFALASETMSAMSRSFFSESKRVRNARIKTELGYELRYPSFREGLRAQLEEELANGWTVIDPQPGDELPTTPSASGGQRNAASKTAPAPVEAETPAKKASGAQQQPQDQPLEQQQQQQQQEKEEPRGRRGATHGWGILASLGWLYRAICKAVRRPFGTSMVKDCCRWVRWVFDNLSVASTLGFAWRRRRRRAPRLSTCLLVDNGSLRPEPFLALRQHAAALQAAAEEALPGALVEVRAVSARFSDRIAPELLDGKRGETAAAVGQAIAKAHGPEHSVVALPYFLGPSATATEFVPTKLRESLEQVRLGTPLVDAKDGEIASILCDMVCRVAEERGLQAPYAVVLVDHGSPSREVNRVRRGLAAQMRRMLGRKARCVVDCSMERREGPEYAFNEPMLESVFSQGGLDSGDVILAMGFLAPGRHAGEGGDIAEILEEARKKSEVRVHQTPLIGDVALNGQRMSRLLLRRLKAALESAPIVD